MSVPDPVTVGITGGLVLSGANQVAKQAQDFLAAATGHPGESIGTMLGNVFHRRVANLESILSDAHFILLNIGVTANDIPLNVLQPALEGASLAEDPNIRTIWANLLANAADPRTPSFVEPSFPTILKDLTSREAKFLDAFFTRARSQGGAHTFPTADVQFLEHNLKEVFDEAGLAKVPISAQPNSPGAIPGEYMVEDDRMGFYMCLDHLIRNRLIEKHVRTELHGALNAGSGQAYETYSLTALGRTFIRACRPPVKS